jgi:hypothetical protein
MVAKLTAAQVRALEAIDLMRRSGGVDLATLRANGNRRDVVNRLCDLSLAYCSHDDSNQGAIRYELTDIGREWLARREETR